MKQHTYIRNPMLQIVHLSLRILLAAGIALLIFFSLLTTVHAQRAPGGNITDPVVSAVNIAKPAVVRILSSTSARLTVNFTGGQSATFPRDGGTYTLAYSGSGAFISSHGDIVTADHVIHPPDDASLDDYLYIEAAQDVADYVNATFGVSPPYTDAQAYYALSSGNFRSKSQYSTAKSLVYLSTHYTGPQKVLRIQDISKNAYAPIESIKKESPFDKDDLAIIHVNMEDTPSIALGSSQDIEQQDELTIIGFPGNADLHTDAKYPEATEFLTASVNKIYVSALKKTPNSSPLIQVGGNVEHGDSGAPALDSSGKIVGIVSFQENGSQPNNTSFLRASSKVQDMVSSLNLDTKPGKFQQAWQSAFGMYASTDTGHWHKAQQAFTKLETDYPDFNAVQPFANYSTAQAKTERVPEATPSTTGTTNVLWYVLGALGVLLLLILGAIILVRRGSKKPPAYQPQNPAFYGPAQGIYPAAPTWQQPGPSPTPWGPPATPIAPSYPSDIAADRNRQNGSYQPAQPVGFEQAGIAITPASINNTPVSNFSQEQTSLAPFKPEEDTDKFRALARLNETPTSKPESSPQHVLPQEEQRPSELAWPAPTTWHQFHPPTGEGQRYGAASEAEQQLDFGAEFKYNGFNQPSRP